MTALQPTVYFVTDIEADGPSPHENSMLSFACVAVTDRGVMAGEFEAVLAPLPGRHANPGTTAWWRTNPAAHAAATANPEAPETVMPRFAAWVAGFAGRRVFAARPLLFDGMWMDVYLHRFAGCRVIDVPHLADRLFHGQGLDLLSFQSGLERRRAVLEAADPVPPALLGDHAHTHRAIDDARGYASLLAHLLGQTGA